MAHSSVALRRRMPQASRDTRSPTHWGAMLVRGSGSSTRPTIGRLITLRYIRAICIHQLYGFKKSVSYLVPRWCNTLTKIRQAWVLFLIEAYLTHFVGVKLWVGGGEQSIPGEDGVGPRHKHHSLIRSDKRHACGGRGGVHF